MSRCRVPGRGALAACLVVAAASTADAQYPVHRLNGVFPPGGKAGEQVELTLSGSDLETVEGVWTDHPGLTAERVEGDAKPPKFRLTIAADVPIGLHDLRVVGPLGVSNPRAFVVGRRPESAEAEPNNGPAEAGLIVINTVVNGQINGGTDRDWFAFDGRSGQRVLAELDAARLDSRLDAELRLYDPEGLELAYSHDGDGRDPFIDAVLPGDGRYLLEVRDVVYAGSPDHTYRLTLHDGPHVDSVVPGAAVAGVESTFTLLGRNLGGEPCETVLADGQPLERKEVRIQVPGDLSPDPEQPGQSFTPSPAAAIAGFSYRYEDDRGAADPVFIAEAIGPVVVGEEASPGPDPTDQRLTVPCDVSADFREVDDVDAYTFEAKKGDVWVIEVYAERIGSPVDPTLLVQQVRDDGTTRDVADADDQNDPGTSSRFATETVDPSLRFQAPEDGVYRVTVGDLYNARRVAPKAVYRLVIRPERPDFRLFAAPADPGNPEGLTIQAGGRAVAYVLAHRIDGYDRPIEVVAEGLPDGVTAAPAVIGGTEAQAPIVFTAAADAAATLGTVRFVGRGLSGDRKEVLASLKDAPKYGPEPERSAVAGSITWGPMQGNAPAPARVTRGLVLAVRPGAPYAIAAWPPAVAAAQGEKVELKATVERHEGFDGEVQIVADALPNRMNGANGKIEKDKNEGTITLDVPGNVEPGMYTILLRGNAKVSFTDPKDDKARDVNLSLPSNPITLTVRKKAQ